MAWTPKQFAKRGASPDAGLRHGFRSGLEEKNAAHLETHGQAVAFETFKIPYVTPAKLHSYTPDFLLPNGIIVETKGIFDATDRAKHLIIKQTWPELDIRFVFTRSQAKIAPGASSTLADWCDRYGYRFADKLIPSAWWLEAGPVVSPKQILSMKRERITL